MAKKNKDSQNQAGNTKPFDTRTVRDRWEKATQETAGLRQNFNLVDLFLRGQQWVYHDPTTARIENYYPGGDRKRARPVMNRMASSMESLMHRALQRSLVFEVNPTGPDDSSIQGAKIGEAAIRYLHKCQNWEDKKEQLARALKKGGTAAIAIDWDADAGDEVADAEAEKGGYQTKQGEAYINPLNITEFLVEPGSRDAETARWWIKAQVLPPEAVQAKYNLSSPPPRTDGISPYGVSFAANQRGIGAAPDGCLVLTYYERPNNLTPKGRVATYVMGADSFVFGPVDWPFPFKDHLNLVVGRDVALEGRWYGTSLYSQAIPIQVSLNACWAAVIEHNAAIGNARMIVPSSNTQILEQLTDDPSHPVIVNAGEEKPGYMVPPPLPQGMVQEIQMLQAELDDLLAVHDISRGEGAGRVESGYGISLLIEQDNSPTGHLVKTVANMFERAASMCLELYNEHSTISRKSLVYIPGQPATSIEWSGEDLAGQTDVSVPVDKMLPRNKAGLQQFATELLQGGMLQPGNIMQFAKIAELPSSNDLIWAVDPVQSRAEWDVHALSEGVPVEPSEGYDHPEDYDKAIAAVRNFMLAPKYDRLPDKSKELIRMYIAACRTMQAAKVAELQRNATMSPQLAPMGVPLPPPPEQQLVPPQIVAPNNQQGK